MKIRGNISTLTYALKVLKTFGAKADSKIAIQVPEEYEDANIMSITAIIGSRASVMANVIVVGASCIPDENKHYSPFDPSWLHDIITKTIETLDTDADIKIENGILEMGDGTDFVLKKRYQSATHLDVQTHLKRMKLDKIYDENLRLQIDEEKGVEKDSADMLIPSLKKHLDRSKIVNEEAVIIKFGGTKDVSLVTINGAEIYVGEIQTTKVEISKDAMGGFSTKRIEDVLSLKPDTISLDIPIINGIPAKLGLWTIRKTFGENSEYLVDACITMANSSRALKMIGQITKSR